MTGSQPTRPQYLRRGLINLARALRPAASAWTARHESLHRRHKVWALLMVLGVGFLVLQLQVSKGAPPPLPRVLEIESPEGTRSLVLVSHDASPQGVVPPKDPILLGERVDPNTASRETLESLPGVGPSLARSIVEDRFLNGPFHDLASMDRVRGIGPSMLMRLEPYLHMDPETAGPAPDESSPEQAQAHFTESKTRQTRRSGPVDLNRAGYRELLTLPGIGPTRARAILEYRSENGNFQAVSDLDHVKGIGPSTLARLADRARIER